MNCHKSHYGTWTSLKPMLTLLSQSSEAGVIDMCSENILFYSNTKYKTQYDDSHYYVTIQEAEAEGLPWVGCHPGLYTRIYIHLLQYIFKTRVVTHACNNSIQDAEPEDNLAWLYVKTKVKKNGWKCTSMVPCLAWHLWGSKFSLQTTNKKTLDSWNSVECIHDLINCVCACVNR